MHQYVHQRRRRVDGIGVNCSAKISYRCIENKKEKKEDRLEFLPMGARSDISLRAQCTKRDRRYFNRILTSRRCCAPLHSVLINSKGVYRFYNVGILIHRRIHTIATRKSVEIHIGRGRDMAGIYNKVIPVMKRLYTYLPKRELHRM